MDHSVTFARHFAELVWLLLRQPGSTDAQKAALRALAGVSKNGSVSLAAHGDSLQANNERVESALAGVRDVVQQMGLHGLAMISVDADATAADLLSVARILAGMPTIGDGGAAAEAQRIAGGATTVRFAARPRLARESMSMPMPTPAHGSPMPDMEFGDVFDDPLAEAQARATPRSTQSITLNPKAHSEGGGLFAQFAAPRLPTESHGELLKQLDVAVDYGVLGNLLDDLVILAETAARERKGGVVCEIMYQLGLRETQIADPESKRTLAMALRRLAKPEPLRAVAIHLPLNVERRGEYVAVLVRAGDQGADAVIEQMAEVAHQRDRRVYADALGQLQAGVPSLLHMLSDGRWFVVRNAAEMLGELQVKEAEKPLIDLLKHEDERVRRAVAGALMRMGTMRAMQAIQAGLADAVPHMRSEAAAALVTRKDARSSTTLLRALDVEKDEQVQAAFLLSLGKLATPDAVDRLIKVAEAERGLFKKKTNSYRVAAIHGLAEAHTAEALDALRVLQADKETDVRDAATFALARISKEKRRISQP